MNNQLLFSFAQPVSKKDYRQRLALAARKAANHRAQVQAERSKVAVENLLKALFPHHNFTR